MLLCRFAVRTLSLALVSALLAGHAPLGAQSAAALPGLGDGAELSPASERRLGDSIARQLYRDPDYLQDLVLMDYVQTIWQPLLAAARQRGEVLPLEEDLNAWQILLGRDRSVNAFALPGGYMGLHLGLIGATQTRAELASVLAHELSHVTQRHIARNMARQSAMAPWVVGAMVLGVLAASKGADNAQGASAAVVGGQALAVQSQLNYSRDMEREADRIGFGVQTQAGFAPQGFVSMFEKLQQSSRLNDAGGFPYLRTHPLTTERIADMQSRVRQSEHANTSPVATLEHAMVAARARVLSDSAVDALRVWELQAQAANLAKLSAAAQVGTLYGASFAAIKQRDFVLAEATLSRLQERLTGNAPAIHLARLLALELRLAQGDVTRAQRLSQSLTDSSRATLLMRTRIDTLAGLGEQVAQTLQTWLADHPRDAQAWQALAAADAAIGRPVAAVRAEGEVNVAQLDYPAALTRFKAAQDMARQSSLPADHIDASIVDTRARQMESLLREQALER